MSSNALTPTAAPPARGAGVTPAWFQFYENGWECSHPHGPGAPTWETGHPPHLVVSYALRHLNRFHPGWKIACAGCGRPQWNAEGSLRCFGCRP